ncbi:MAG: PHP domain-containing protein, partial [Mycobacterium sp.]
SWDTGPDASMEAACRRAIDIGLPSIAFTEHVDFTAWGADDHPAGTIVGRHRVEPVDVEGYLASVQSCREQFAGLRVLSGIEVGEPHHFAGSVATVLASGRFDRVLGSLHSIVHDGHLVGVHHVFAHRPVPDVMRSYFDELVRLVEGSSVFQVLAHCDYPRRYWPRREGPYREAAFEEEYRVVFRALAASGRALELNTTSPLASTTLMRWWHEEGGDAVSFGSDAHLPLRVGQLFDVAVDIVEAAGFRPGRDEYDFWRR